MILWNKCNHFADKKSKKKNDFKQIELQLDFQEDKNDNDAIIEKLKEVKPLEITPIDALNILVKIKDKIK